MWNARTREGLWSALDEQPWDIVIVGGGITGASLFREAVRAGLRTLLVEQHDFAWGASSRTSKLVHAGLGALDCLRLGRVRASLRERERLLREGAGLVVPLPFLLAWPPSGDLRRWKARVGVALYDALTGRLPRPPVERAVLAAMPSLPKEEGLAGLSYDEAWVDDARLVLRLLREGAAAGGQALNHVRVPRLVREAGRVVGVELFDVPGQRTATVRARAVVNATGAWADFLRAQVDGAPRVRTLRGSHLVFSSARLPLRQGLSFRHPRDGRHLCAVPWEDATLLGAAEVEHAGPLDVEPSIRPEEVAYLMEAAAHAFPGLELTLDDVVSTSAGVRPALAREPLVLEEEGLLTVAGGELATCRLLARQALRRLRPRLPALAALKEDAPFLAAPPHLEGTALPAEVRIRLSGRYGAEARGLLEAAREGELEPVPCTSTLWAEVRWAARSEGVVHLDDLMLRRVRLGLLVPQGGALVLPRVRALCQEELGWSDSRWAEEERAYLALWTRHYGLPVREAIPTWGAPQMRSPARGATPRDFA